MPPTEPLRLVLTPHGRHGEFDAYLGDTLVCTSRQPLLDGARELLRLGHDPAALLTTRHDGKAYDNFIPSPLGLLALWTIAETDRGLQRRRYEAFPSSRVASPMRDSALPVPEAAE